MPFAFDPLRPTPLRLDHGASLTAFDERKLQPFASAADGGYPELSPWRQKRGCAMGVGYSECWRAVANVENVESEIFVIVIFETMKIELLRSFSSSWTYMSEILGLLYTWNHFCQKDVSSTESFPYDKRLPPVTN